MVANASGQAESFTPAIMRLWRRARGYPNPCIFIHSTAAKDREWDCLKLKGLSFVGF